MHTTYHDWCQKWTPLIARILLSGIFIMSGLAKVFNFEGTAGYIASVGIPFSELGVIVAILIEVLGGLSILFGFKVRWGAEILAVYTVDMRGRKALRRTLDSVAEYGKLLEIKREIEDDPGHFQTIIRDHCGN